MNMMPQRVINKKAYLRTRSPFRLSKDFGLVQTFEEKNNQMKKHENMFKWKKRCVTQ
jgi:hypothetical protein